MTSSGGRDGSNGTVGSAEGSCRSPRALLERIGLLLGTLGVGGLLLLMPLGAATPDWLRGGLVAAVLVALCGLLLRRPPFTARHRLAVAGILLLLASFALSALLSPLPRLSLERSMTLPISAAAGLLAIRLGAAGVAGRWLAGAALVAVLLLCTDLLWQASTGASLFGAVPAMRRLQGSLPNPNDLCMVVPLAALALGVAGASRVAYAVLGGVLLLTLGVVFLLSDSWNLLVGAVGGGSVLLLWGVGRRGLWLAGVGVVAAIVLAGLLLWQSPRREAMFDRIVGAPLSDPEGAGRTIAERGAAIRGWIAGSARGRLAAVAWSGFIERPIVGFGPGLFAEAWWRIRGGGEWGEPVPREGYHPWAHNLPLETLAERGVVGLAAVLLLLAVPTVAMRRTRRRNIGAAAGADAATRRAVSAAAAIGAILAMGLFDLTLLKDWVSLLLLVSIGLCEGSSSPSEERAGDDGHRCKDRRKAE